MTGPKRNLFKEYSQDLNYYMEHFDCLKKEMKNKTTSLEIRQFQNQISQDVTKFLSTIIKEEPNQIHDKILEIAKSLKENKQWVNIENAERIFHVSQNNYPELKN